MIFIVVLITSLALSAYTIAGETCPSVYLRISEQHSFCKPQNPNCKFVLKGFPTDDEKKEIVNIHNNYRNKVAMGDEKLAGGLPTASNMLAVSWDDELAQIAQKWAEQCVFEHDCRTCRGSSSFSVGQNIGYLWYSCSGQCEAKRGNWPATLKMFYDEVKDFNKGLVKAISFNGPMIGHFTQLTWAKTYKVGCGYAGYEEGGGVKQLHVCNYGPAGNMRDEPLYIEGSPCSNCPENSCCGSTCKDNDQKKFPGLCFLSSSPPKYARKQGLLYFCTFEDNDKNCEFDSEGPGRWELSKTAGGTFLSVVIQTGQTAVVRFRQSINVKRGSCMNISLRKGPNVAGEKDDSSVDVEFENNGQKNQVSVWTYPWADFITSPVQVNSDGNTKFSLKVTVPADAPTQYLEIKQIEITEAPCKYGK